MFYNQGERMKKILTVCACIFMLTGCILTNIEQNKQFVYDAGYAASIIYVDREKPSAELKSNIVDTVNFVVSNVSETNTLTSYSATLRPVVTEYIAKSNFKPVNKIGVMIASKYVLTCVDGLLAKVNTTNVTSNVGYIYVKEFSTGFVDGMGATSFSPEVSYIIESGYKK